MNKFKFLIIGKKGVLCIGLAVFVAFFGIFCGAGWNKTLTTTANTKKLPIYCTETDKKQIAISFDAAWGNSFGVQNLNKARKTRENKPFSVSFSVL